jgi:hypothetical protein
MEKMELLEQKIRKVTDIIRSLRKEHGIMEEQLRSTRDELKRASSRTAAPAEDGHLSKLQEERQTIAQRIERMITLIEEVEAS